MERLRLHITGVVQGVGMRPFVYREAAAHGISGWVLNASDGVHIEAVGDGAGLDAFTAALRSHAPAAARIDDIEVTERETVSGENQAGGAAEDFRIIASEESDGPATLISPDIATCPDCIRELFDPADRRYHYPFINCTNCGPRFTIIRSLPYDRASTSMDAFPMCPECEREYRDPMDRRFHAQPDACFSCGPHITWREDAGVSETGCGEDRSDGSDLADGLLHIGDRRISSDAIIERCAEVLSQGGIVAVKGLGGFHLACSAQDDGAVRELRRRKRRSNKPFAIMVRNLDHARGLCEIGIEEQELLCGSIRPIVLMRRRGDARKAAPRTASFDAGADGGAGEDAPSTPLAIAPAVAFDLPELGVMLPYTPLQHLLLDACAAHGVDALVMTSGNISGEPIEVDDDAAWERLVEGGIADALLGNDRPILSRYDDSVVRVCAGRPQMVRRARGYAPAPIALPALSESPDPSIPSDPSGAPTTSGAASSSRADLPCILACGPEQKSTIALTREEDGAVRCFVSQHIGDIESAGAAAAWHDARNRLQDLFGLEPHAFACDMHPSYRSSVWARGRAEEMGAELIEVQHHHAHIASVFAEAAARGEIDPAGEVIGIALDGTGAGEDATIWGGEVMIADLQTCRRIAHLRTWPLPGAAGAIRDPRRCAVGLLHEYGLLGHPGAQEMLATFAQEELDILHTMIERGINSPRTSSAGRLLDALSALCGICPQATYEGEPAILLEAAATQSARRMRADRSAPSGNPDATTPGGGAALDTSALLDDRGGLDGGTVADNRHAPGDCAILDLRRPLEMALDALARGGDPSDISLRIHEEVADIFASAAIDAARMSGIGTVALSGGCFMNRLLLDAISARLEAAGLRVLLPRELPFNDGCIAYGQAAVARARIAAARAL